MWSKKTVAAIIPTGKNQKTIFKVIEELNKTGYVDEILVVDNGIDSETLKEVERTRARFIKKRKYGIGRAIRTGIRKTKADLLIIIEPSGAFKSKDISKLLAYSQDFDTVFGSRTHLSLLGENTGMTISRRLVNDIFGKIISLLFLSSNLTDVGCTFRLTNRKGWRKVARESKSNGYIFLTQWLILAAKNKVRFIEIPVNFTSSKRENLIFLSLRALRILFEILKFGVVKVFSQLF